MECLSCKVDKSEQEFNWESKQRGIKRKKVCVACCVARNKLSREKNRAAYNQKSNERRHERKKRMIEYKGGKCLDCSGQFHWSAMDFHHLDSTTKHRDPGLLMGNTDETLKKEVDKCVLLCANCHRIRHFNEGY